MSPRELVAGLDGLDFHRRILQEGSNRLKEGGRIFVEIGDGQSDRVEVLFLEAYGYNDTFFLGKTVGLTASLWLGGMRIPWMRGIHERIFTDE